MTPLSPRFRLVCAAAIVLASTLWTVPGRANGEPDWLDFSGDGRSDFVIASLATAPELRWWVSDSATSDISVTLWGVEGDRLVPGDYDGDGIVDPAIWRPGPAGSAGFWILPSTTGIGYFQPFGQTGDWPHIVGDYDGDGKTDVAVFRGGIQTGDPSFWFYKRSSDGGVVATPWGVEPDFPITGDYDGDGKHDLVVGRAAALRDPVTLFLNQSSAGIAITPFGRRGDGFVPGDYDGDGKTDIALIDNYWPLNQPVGHPSGAYTWWIKRSSDAAITAQTWGYNLSDKAAPADYDGDGKTDIAVFRHENHAWGWWVVSASAGGSIVRLGMGVSSSNSIHEAALADRIGVH
jgi:spore coat protein A, manganese oxidase